MAEGLENKCMRLRGKTAVEYEMLNGLFTFLLYNFAFFTDEDEAAMSCD